MSLPTLSGNAVTGLDGRSSATAGETFGSGTSGGRTRTVRTIAVGTIIGIVVAALAVIFFIVIGICICVRKKKKQRQLAADAQTIAAMQASRPQSMFPAPPPPPPPQQQQMQQQGGYMAPPLLQSPQPTLHGYFAPTSPVGPGEEKYNGHTSLHEYAAIPMSNPSSPGPYQGTGMEAGAGAQEVDAVSRPQVPANGRPVYELGDGR